MFKKFHILVDIESWYEEKQQQLVTGQSFEVLYVFGRSRFHIYNWSWDYADRKG